MKIRIVQHPMGHGFPRADADQIMAILGHPRGWATRGHAFERVWSGGDVIVYLRPPAYMARRFGEPELRSLSVTESVVGQPYRIHIHASNWNRVPSGFEGDLATYRAYLIQHEIGHCLGHGHEPTPPVVGHDLLPPCPVMYQQTRGTRGRCRPNYHPLASEARGRQTPSHA